MSSQSFAVIGTPGQPWGDAERTLWRSQQPRKRSYADEVLVPIDALGAGLEVLRYGELDYAPEVYPLLAFKSRDWRDSLPSVLVTGGVHGYETSGVHGALRFVERHAADYAGRVNLLIAPCVSPWAYERVHRWNPLALDPNRSFRDAGSTAEAAALIGLIAPLREQFVLHIDLHETTDSDETEFRPALAARDGKARQSGEIPDGFYLVGDSEKPELDFQQAVIEAVARVTHIAPADAHGRLIGAQILSPGVIAYPVKKLGLCAGVTDARYTTTTEVYPDSPRATAQQCNQAQATAVCAAIDFVLRAQPTTRPVQASELV